MKGEHFLVTGGFGFIGGWLVHRLLTLGAEVTVIDSDIRGGRQSVPFKESDCSLVIDKCISSESVLKKVFKTDFSGIFHMAAFNGTQNFYSAPFDVLSASALGTLHLCKYMAETGIKTPIIYTGSAESYAFGLELGVVKIPTPPNVPISLGSPLEPRWSYAAGKTIGEYALGALRAQYSIPMSICRVHNIYGPRMGYNHFVSDVINRFQKGQMELPGATETRSFCYVDDCIDALLMVMEKFLSCFNDVPALLHIGSDKEIQIRTAAEIICKQIGVNPAEIRSVDSWQGSPKRRCPDIKIMKQLMGNNYIPTSFSGGIAKTVEWYQKHELPSEKDFR